MNQAVEIALGSEAAEQHTQQLKSEAVIKQVSPANRMVLCKHCGKNNHHTSKCHYKEAINFVILVIRKDIWQRFVEPKGSNNQRHPKRKLTQTKEPGGLEQSK